MSEPRELAPDSVEYRLVARIIATVAEQAGRSSRWTGRIVVDPDPAPENDATESDGTLWLSDVNMLAPIRRAYAARDSGRTLSAADLDQLHVAVAIAAHEAVHLIERDGDAPDGHPIRDAPEVALDEGLVEQWTHDHLDDVVVGAGLDRKLPGLVGHEPKNPYPAYTAAIRTLLDGVSPLTGRSPQELAAELLTTDRSQRWNLLADLAIAHELGGDATAADRTEVANTLRQGFAEVQLVQKSGLHDAAYKKREGGRIGRGTASALELALDTIRTANEEVRAAALQPPGSEFGRLDGILRDQPGLVPGFARADPDDAGKPAPVPVPSKRLTTRSQPPGWSRA